MTIYPNVHNNLNLGSVYYCPVCRHGELSAMPLMEAMGCNFCRHIFTVNLERQLLKMADSHIALTWHWDGRSWKGLQKEGFEPDWFYWLAGVAFVLIPPLIVGFGAYLFPPLADDPLYWVPFVWTPLTFFCHLINYVIVAGKPEYEPIILKTTEYNPVFEDKSRQVFFTTLEKKYIDNKPIEIQN